MRIRPTEETDLPACAAIWDRTVAALVERYEPDEDPPPSRTQDRLTLFRHLRETGAVFVAEDREPVGFSAAVIREGVWFLSQLWVLPEYQGRGIGAALLDETLAWGRGARAFSVVSSPHPAAQLLYLRASMYPMWTSYALTGSRLPVPESPPGVEDLRQDDQTWVDDLDRSVRGMAAPEDHRFFRDHAVGVSLRRDGRPVGYVYAWPDGRVGPVAAREPGDLSGLLLAGRHLAGPDVTVNVPGPNWTALRELLRVGLRPTRSNAFLASRPLGDGTRYVSGGGALG